MPFVPTAFLQNRMFGAAAKIPLGMTVIVLWNTVCI